MSGKQCLAVVVAFGLATAFGLGPGAACVRAAPSYSVVDLFAMPSGVAPPQGDIIGGVQDPEGMGGGAVVSTSGNHAFLQTTAGTVNLNPSGCSESAAFGTNGSQQVGYGVSTGVHAMLWNGTAASFVNLYPTSGIFTLTEALGTNGSQQVGWGMLSSGWANALLERHRCIPCRPSARQRIQHFGSRGNRWHPPGWLRQRPFHQRRGQRLALEWHQYRRRSSTRQRIRIYHRLRRWR